MADKKTKVVKGIQTQAIKDWGKQQAEKLEKLRVAAMEKAYAAARRANQQVNGPQLMAAAVPAFIFAPLGAFAQQKIVDLTSSMVTPTEDGTDYVSTPLRHAFAWGTVPAVGAAVSYFSLKFGNKKPGYSAAAAGGFGVGLGLAIGSFVSSIRTPLVANPPPVEV